MGYTTTSTLWRSLVALSSSAGSFLWSWFLSRPCNVTYCLCSFPDALPSMFEVFKYVVHYVSSERIVKDTLVEVNDFTCCISSS